MKALAKNKILGVDNLPLLFIFYLFLPAQLFTVNEYPKWFLYPRINNDIVIGFSYKTTPAIIDARRMYCVYKKNEVFGYLETIKVSGEKYCVKSDYYYYFDHSCYENTKTDSLFLLDGFGISAISMDYVQAYSYKKQAKINKEIVEISDIEAPYWINKNVWNDDEYFYGVGMFVSDGNKNDAWKTSEEKAIYNILTSNSINIYSLKYLNKDNSELNEDIVLNYNRIVLNFLLRNVETLERWPHEDGYYYTLVRINKKDIILNE